jgi:nucleoside-diphosphate-sugar epimerase
MRITVLGATGGAGQAITTELAARGHDVVAASRSAIRHEWPARVTPLTTDLADATSTAAACRDADVVVMAAQVPYAQWATELPGLVDRAADATAAAGARLVMVDNLYAYGSPGTPISESAPESATTRKGKLRTEIGQRLLARHDAGELRVTVGRFADYYGPVDGNSLLNQLLLAPAVRGKTPRTFIADDQPHTFHALRDVGRAFATLVEDERADGRIWILPAAPAITQAEAAGLAAEALGRPVRHKRVTPTMLWLLGLVNRQLREAREVVAQFDRPYLIDASAFEATFGPFETTPHVVAIADTVAWLQQEQPTTV